MVDDDGEPRAVVKPIVFIAVSALFVLVSWNSLRTRRSHGFPRFFAWEIILGLVLLSAERWFRDPLSTPQAVSWVLLMVSLVLAVLGFHMLIGHGKADSSRVDDTLAPFERTTALVTSGVYRYIRHPLYGSQVFLVWGVFLKLPSWLGLALALAATVLLWRTAKLDEEECFRYFGPDYKEYMTRSRMFVPFVF